MTSTWTANKPTKPGWYWWRREGRNVQIRHVVLIEETGQLYCNSGDVFKMTNCEWSDRSIEEPTEPKEAI